MFEQAFTHGSQKRTVDEKDIRHYIESYLRQQLRTDAIYCTQVQGKKVSVVVRNAADAQAVYVSQYELGQAVKAVLGVEISSMSVIQRW